MNRHAAFINIAEDAWEPILERCHSNTLMTTLCMLYERMVTMSFNLIMDDNELYTNNFEDISWVSVI